MEKETFEEAARNYIKGDDLSTFSQRAFFIAGAKWQAQRMYSEEDMKKCWSAAYIDALSIDDETYKPLFFKDFIEQFKNKL